MYEEEDLAVNPELEQEFFEHFRFKVDKGQTPLRIDKFLMMKIPNASRTRIQKGIEAGCVTVDSKTIKSNFKVKPLQIISVVLPDPPRDTELKAENIPLDIVYEDDSLLLVNKPAGMVVHPGFNNYNGTLVNGLLFYFNSLPTNANGRPGLVHRIDKDTSGLLVVSKTEDALVFLAKQFFDHTIDRKYFALVWGNLTQEFGTIIGNLTRDTKDRRRSVVTPNPDEGKHAVTHYQVEERFGFMTLVSCKLETGRTHQIRAHMRHIGHPLFNDAMYDGDTILKGSTFTKYKQFIDNCFSVMQRQALHAFSLGFEHPVTHKRIYFETPLPEDFQNLLEKIRRYVNAPPM